MRFLLWLVIFALFAGAYMLRKTAIASKLVIVAVILAVLVIAFGKYLNYL